LIYTTYFSKIKSIPNNSIKLIVTRFPPKWFKLDDIIQEGVYEYEVLNDADNLWVVTSLSPSKELLLKYKEDLDWESFKETFIDEMNSKPEAIEMLSRIETYLKQEKDIYFICFEKDYNVCHRSLIAMIFKDKGYVWKEFNINREE
jgi:uncharacterized protein YeaO (DUF488 family)